MQTENKNDNTQEKKAGFDVREFLLKNKVKVFAFGGALLLLVILMAVSSTINRQPRPMIPLTSLGGDVLDSAVMEKSRQQYDIFGSENYKKESKTQIISDTPKYPSPSFVTSGRDTLIWENGLYKRIAVLHQLNEPKDTVQINGKTYIREDKIYEYGIIRDSLNTDTLSVQTEIKDSLTTE